MQCRERPCIAPCGPGHQWRCFCWSAVDGWVGPIGACDNGRSPHLIGPCQTTANLASCSATTQQLCTGGPGWCLQACAAPQSLSRAPPKSPNRSGQAVASEEVAQPPNKVGQDNIVHDSGCHFCLNSTAWHAFPQTGLPCHLGLGRRLDQAPSYRSAVALTAGGWSVWRGCLPRDLGVPLLLLGEKSGTTSAQMTSWLGLMNLLFPTNIFTVASLYFLARLSALSSPNSGSDEAAIMKHAVPSPQMRRCLFGQLLESEAIREGQGREGERESEVGPNTAQETRRERERDSSWCCMPHVACRPQFGPGFPAVGPFGIRVGATGRWFSGAQALARLASLVPFSATAGPTNWPASDRRGAASSDPSIPLGGLLACGPPLYGLSCYRPVPHTSAPLSWKRAAVGSRWQPRKEASLLSLRHGARPGAPPLSPSPLCVPQA